MNVTFDPHTVWVSNDKLHTYIQQHSEIVAEHFNHVFSDPVNWERPILNDFFDFYNMPFIARGLRTTHDSCVWFLEQLR